MGPVISSDSRAADRGLIAQGVADGARPVVDGRGATVPGYERGNFLRADGAGRRRPGERARADGGLRPGAERHARADRGRGDRHDQPVAVRQHGVPVHQQRRRRAPVPLRGRTGNIGINVGVAAPMAYFPFSGWKDSFFGDLHAQGRDAIDFLHREEDRRRALAADVEPEVLRRNATRNAETDEFAEWFSVDSAISG